MKIQPRLNPISYEKPMQTYRNDPAVNSVFSS
jgi:hypothetical protein